MKLGKVGRQRERKTGRKKDFEAQTQVHIVIGETGERRKKARSALKIK